MIKKLLSLAIVLSLLLLAASSGIGADSDAPQQQTIFNTVTGGGPLLVLIWVAIIATSMTMVTLVIQNIMMLREARVAPPALFEALENAIAGGNYQEAWEICAANRNYLANVLKAGLSRLGRGKEAVEDAIAEHGLREATLIRTRNSYLSVIGVISPMIGLLGTVIGMMGAFSVLGNSGIGDPRALASKIGEVLLATASGLFIAIPAFVFYYVFRNRAQVVIVHGDDMVNRLVRDIPFEELEGLQIGEKFSAGALEAIPEAGESRNVSLRLTTHCPVCSGPVNAGENPCPGCGTTLEWKR